MCGKFGEEMSPFAALLRRNVFVSENYDLMFVERLQRQRKQHKRTADMSA